MRKDSTTAGRQSAGDAALADWTSPEWQGPHARLRDDLCYRTIWLARAFAGREHLFEKWERRVQRRILEQSRASEEAPVREVAHLSVREADGSTVRRLIANHVPFVIDGYLKETQAVRDWSLDTLNERCGKAAVHSFQDGLESETDRRPWYHEHTFEWATFGDAIDSMRRGEQNYVTGVSAIFKQHPELIQEAGLPEIERFVGHAIRKPELFVGSTQNQTYFHCATAANVFLQIHGHKKWVLTHSHHSNWMYPSFGFGRLVMRSPIISTRPDVTDDYPLFGAIPRFTVHLGPGDLYYNPSWIWHEVWNVTETIGIAARIIPSVRTPNPFFDFVLYTSGVFLKYLPAMVWDSLTGGRKFAFDDSMASEAYRHRSSPR